MIENTAVTTAAMYALQTQFHNWLEGQWSQLPLEAQKEWNRSQGWFDPDFYVEEEEGETEPGTEDLEEELPEDEPESEEPLEL